MTESEFEEFRHSAVHALIERNARCQHDVRISQWESWGYDLDSATLTFSDDGIPKVIAEIQVVGTTSKQSETWMWGWANTSLPPGVTASLSVVREFGIREGLTQFTEAQIPDYEDLGWDLTAITAQLIGAKGAYRCPSERGFVYVVYTDLAFADLARANESSATANTVMCGTHGRGQQTFICEHLMACPELRWLSKAPTSENRWPDAWCTQCDQAYQEQGEWNDSNLDRLQIKVLCHRCYELLRAQSTSNTQ